MRNGILIGWTRTKPVVDAQGRSDNKPGPWQPRHAWVEHLGGHGLAQAWLSKDRDDTLDACVTTELAVDPPADGRWKEGWWGTTVPGTKAVTQ